MRKRLKIYFAALFRRWAQKLDYRPDYYREVPEYHRLPEGVTMKRKEVRAEYIMSYNEWIRMYARYTEDQIKAIVFEKVLKEMGAEIIHELKATNAVDFRMLELDPYGGVTFSVKTFIFVKNE